MYLKVTVSGACLLKFELVARFIVRHLTPSRQEDVVHVSRFEMIRQILYI